MGGLARRFGSTYRDSEGEIGNGPDCYADLMSHWLNVAGRTGMPCDPRLWTEAPISSTFPACIADRGRRRAGLGGRLRLSAAPARRPALLPAGVGRAGRSGGRGGAGALHVARFTAALDSTDRSRPSRRTWPRRARCPRRRARWARRASPRATSGSASSAIFIGADGERHGALGLPAGRGLPQGGAGRGASQVNEGPLPALEAAARFGRLAIPEIEAL